MTKKKEDDKIGLFQQFVSRLLHILRYIRKHICELLGGIILSACLVLGIVAALAIILVIHNYGNSKFP